MDLHVKYRPTELDAIIGQNEVVRSLNKLLDAKQLPHSILLHGPSGVGKTTIARILAAEVQAQIMEIDAATNTGIDAMREIVEPLQYRGFGEKENKVVILDECQSLSKSAWQSLLKIVEEPPKHVYFLFCTTELDKVPKTIQTRSHSYGLRAVVSNVLEEYLDKVIHIEKFKLPDGVVEVIAREAQGSVRQALTYLSACRSARSVNEAKSLMSAAGDGAEAIEFYRLLVSGRANWKQCMLVLGKLEGDLSYESLRIGVMNYTGAVLANTKNENQAAPLLAVLEAFQTPFNRSTERAAFLLALGTCVLG